MATVSYFKLLALNGVLEIFLSTVHHLNLTVGMARATSLVIAVRAVITIPIVLWLVPIHGNPTAAATALARSCLTAPLNVCVVGRAIKFGARDRRHNMAACNEMSDNYLCALRDHDHMDSSAQGIWSSLASRSLSIVQRYDIHCVRLGAMAIVERHGMRRSLDTGKYRWA
jgi:hypothetical protein